MNWGRCFKMKEILSYLKAKKEAVPLEIMISKFKDKDIPQILNQLINEGQIWEPTPNMLKWLG